ncbi:hypothetical protein VPHD479_0304 [Vibrio phage D479]
MGLFDRLFNRTPKEPTVWKVIGQTPEKRGEITGGHYFGKTVLTFRVYIVENQYGKRKIKLNVINQEGSVPWSESTVIDETIKLNVRSNVCSSWSIEKINKIHGLDLISYDTSKWEEQRYINEYI